MRKVVVSPDRKPRGMDLFSQKYYWIFYFVVWINLEDEQLQLATIHANVFPDMNANLASNMKTVPNLILLGRIIWKVRALCKDFEWLSWTLLVSSLGAAELQCDMSTCFQSD